MGKRERVMKTYRRFIRFVITVVFMIKLDWSVCICLTQLYADRDMYRIYYIKTTICFGTLHGQCKVPKHIVVLYVINSIHISTSI